MFSMFPDGLPGAGLLVLRVTAGTELLLQGIAYFLGNKPETGVLAWVALGTMGIVGLLLVIGFMTRYVALGAAVVAVATGFSWFSTSPVGSLVTPTSSALSAAIAVAVICLGPGALSLDARCFGRREIVIPPSSPQP